MAEDNWVRTAQTSNGLGGFTQNLNTGMWEDADGNPQVPDVEIPRGATKIVQQEMIGAFRRTVFDNGQVETVQVEPANQSDGSIVTPVPLPGEKLDVTGTGMDAATKPKVAPGAKTGKAAEKLGES